MAVTPRDTSSERSPKEQGYASTEAVDVPAKQNEDRVVTDVEKRAVRKLDYTIVPVMTMFYLLSFLVITFSANHL
jgi:hypothetical protein